MHQKASRTCSTIIFPHSTNQIIVFWRCRCPCCHPCLSSLGTTGTATTSPQINDLISWIRKNNRAARAARFLVRFLDVVCQIMTSSFHIWRSDDNTSSQKWIFHSLPLHEKLSCQASESALRLFCTMWPTCNNRKTLNIAESSILMRRFRCSSRRSFLNSFSTPNVHTTDNNNTSLETILNYPCQWCLAIASLSVSDRNDQRNVQWQVYTQPAKRHQQNLHKAGKNRWSKTKKSKWICTHE